MKTQKLVVILALVIVVLFVVLGVSNRDDANVEEEALFSGDETKILLYFADKEQEKLVSEYRNVNLYEIKENVFETIIKELIKGPSTEEFASTIPKDTQINEIKQEGNKVVVDFSKDYKGDQADQNLELLKTYSIVNSLTELKEIDEVEIKVNGVTVAKEKRI